MPDNTGLPPNKYNTRLTEAVEQLRTNVKWTLIAFGAIGTTLLAGSQLSNLGKFSYSDARLWIALICAIVALGAASYAVYVAQSVAYSGYTQLNHLDHDDRAFLNDNNTLLEGFKTIDEIKEAYESCIAERHNNMTNGADIETLKADKSNFQYLDNLVDNILSFVRYNRIRTQVERSRNQLTLASLFAAIGLLGFAWAANPEKTPPIIALSTPVPEASVELTDAGKKGLAPLLGDMCVRMPTVSVLVLNVTASGSDVLSEKSKACPNARFTLTDALGKFVAPTH